MPRILITGMSGAGKSTLLAELARRGHATVDTDHGGWTDGSGGPWDEARMTALLAARADVVVSGTVENQGRFYDRFEHVIASGEVGAVKPDARIFRAAVERFGVDAAQAAYVGDRLRTDAIGAAEAGLLGVWLDRNGSATADELREAAGADVVVIHSLSDLPAVVR